MSKLIETVLSHFVEIDDDTDNYQFSLEKNHSTASCTHVLKQTVNYYVQGGSHVFCAFIDFNKAFDNVDYCLVNSSTTCLFAGRVVFLLLLQ